MDINKIKNIINSIFSDGYGENNFKILIPSSEISIKISNTNNSTSLLFTDVLPCIKIKKFISLSFSIEGIILNENDGYIKIKNFPDIPISYLNGIGEVYGAKSYDIESCIDQEFTDENKKKIAHKCLQCAESWAIITSSSGINFANANASERTKLKKMCHNFVVDNVRKEMKQEYGSVVLSWVLLFVIIPSVARFIVTRLLNKIF